MKIAAVLIIIMLLVPTFSLKALEVDKEIISMPPQTYENMYTQLVDATQYYTLDEVVVKVEESIVKVRDYILSLPVETVDKIKEKIVDPIFNVVDRAYY